MNIYSDKLAITLSIAAFFLVFAPLFIIGGVKFGLIVMFALGVIISVVVATVVYINKRLDDGKELSPFLSAIYMIMLPSLNIFLGDVSASTYARGIVFLVFIFLFLIAGAMIFDGREKEKRELAYRKAVQDGYEYKDKVLNFPD